MDSGTRCGAPLGVRAKRNNRGKNGGCEAVQRQSRGGREAVEKQSRGGREVVDSSQEVVERQSTGSPEAVQRRFRGSSEAVQRRLGDTARGSWFEGLTGGHVGTSNLPLDVRNRHPVEFETTGGFPCVTHLTHV